MAFRLREDELRRRRGYDRVRAATDERRLYNSVAWRRLRLSHLREHPFCASHEERGQVVPAGVVDHVVPHAGSPELFWDPTNLRSLCSDCHDRLKRREETRGHRDDIGADGWPTDPRHPANR